MEIYRNNCLPLPQQVEQNRHDVQTLYALVDGAKWNKTKITLDVNGWESMDGRKYEYNIINDTFIDDMLFIVTAADEKSTIQFSGICYAESYDSGIKLTSFYKPDVDIEIIVYYNYNVNNNN